MSLSIYSGEVIGLPELSANLQKLAKMIDEKAVEDGLFEIDKDLREGIRNRTPIALRGHWSGKGKMKTWIAPGNLRKSIVAKKYKYKIKGAPAVFLAVNFAKGPHAHLVEFGHGGKHPAPAHPFFRPAVDSYRVRYLRSVENMLREKFEQWVKPEHRFTEPLAPTFESVAASM